VCQTSSFRLPFLQTPCNVSQVHDNIRYSDSSAAWVLICSIIVFFMVSYITPSCVARMRCSLAGQTTPQATTSRWFLGLRSTNQSSRFYLYCTRSSNPVDMLVRCVSIYYGIASLARPIVELNYCARFCRVCLWHNVLQMHCSTDYMQVWFSLSCAESRVHVGGGVVCQECEGEEERHHHRECLILHVCMPHKDEWLASWPERLRLMCIFIVAQYYCLNLNHFAR